MGVGKIEIGGVLSFSFSICGTNLLVGIGSPLGSKYLRRSSYLFTLWGLREFICEVYMCPARSRSKLIC